MTEPTDLPCQTDPLSWYSRVYGHRLYLAGPMRGIAEFNFPAFHQAATELRAAGHEVFNPAEYDEQVTGFNPAGLTGHEDLAGLKFDLRDALRKDLDWIATHASAVAVLPGWETSKGANAEVALARALGLPVGTVPQFVAGAEPDVASAPAVTGEVRLTSATGGQKGSKTARYDLIPAGPLHTLAELYGRGAAKYADRNWERGYDWSLSFAALMRHAWAFWSGEDLDPEMGTPHIVNAAWHAFALAEFMARHPQFDNRPATAAAAGGAA